MSFRFVHAADLHLDAPFQGVRECDEQAAQQLREATFRALETICDLCREREAAFLILAGDVYNAEDRSLRAQLRLREALNGLHEAGMRTFIVHGNHDPLKDPQAGLSWPEGVHVFAGPQPQTAPALELDGELCTVTGVSFERAAVTDNLALGFERPPGTDLAVAVLHCNVGGVSGHGPYAPCTLDDLRRRGFDYWALGHVHAPQVLQAQGPAIVYPGSSQGLNSKETGPHGCYVVEVAGGQVSKLEFVATDAVRWFGEDVDVGPAETEDELIARLDERVASVRERAEGRPALVRVVLAGRGPGHAVARRQATEQLLEIARDRAQGGDQPVWVESLTVRTVPARDLDALRRHPFLGDLLREVERARGDREARQALDEALKGLRGWPEVARISEFGEADMLEWLDGAEQRLLDELVPEGGEGGVD